MARALARGPWSYRTSSLQPCRTAVKRSSLSEALFAMIRKNIERTSGGCDECGIDPTDAMMTSYDDSEPEPKPAFGKWLLGQRDRGDWVDGIAEAARADRTFPKAGDPEAVRAHLRKQQADGDAFAAIDDAESDWMAD